MWGRPKSWTICLITILTVMLTACGSSGDETTPTLTPTEPPTATSAPIATLAPTIIPTRTPAPTARPLSEDTQVPGIYRDTTYGVSFVYPDDWDLTEEDEGGLKFVSILHPDIPAIIYLTMDFVAEGEDYEPQAEEFHNMVLDSMGLASITWQSVDPDYELDDGRDAWRGMAEGLFSGVNDPLSYETIATQRGSYVFYLITMAREEWDPAIPVMLKDTRQSFQVFLPSPLGVIRDDALFLDSSDPVTLDPAKWHGGADSILGDLFSGLVKLNSELQVIPDLAESWTVSPDGTVYTFNLRQGVTFHNGREFTASDVKYSWERACNPETESDTAETYLGDIVGVADVITGDETEISGLTVVDDYTLEVTLDAPKAYFLHKLSYVASWIVDSETIDDIEEFPIGTGPFKLVDYDESEHIILARNENYYRKYVQLEYVVYLIDQGYPIRLYESGAIDVVAVNEELVDRAEDPMDPLFGNVQPITGLCTSYVVFDVSQPPFEDKLVREAFTKAIDKERYNDVVSDGKGVIAEGLYPPGLPGYTPDVVGIPYDPENAVSALEESSYGGAAGLPTITLTIAGEGGDLYPSDAILLQMWNEVLGIDVVVEQIDYDSYFDEVYAGNHGQLLSTGWCADYPDPENFADFLFHSDGEQNMGNYTNPELDLLLEEARSMADIQARIALYQQIQQIIVDDMPVAFIRHSRPYYLITKPYVQELKSPPIGVAQLMNVYIEYEE